jgi:hypothetical protein
MSCFGPLQFTWRDRCPSLLLRAWVGSFLDRQHTKKTWGSPGRVLLDPEARMDRRYPAARMRPAAKICSTEIAGRLQSSGLAGSLHVYSRPPACQRYRLRVARSTGCFQSGLARLQGRPRCGFFVTAVTEPLVRSGNVAARDQVAPASHAARRGKSEVHRNCPAARILRPAPIHD